MTNEQKINNQLIFSIKEHNLVLFNQSLAAGADPNTIDADGNSALILALQTKNWDFADRLIHSGAIVNVTDNNGNSALFLAQDNMKLKAELEENGATFNAKDQAELADESLYVQGYTPQMVVAQILANNEIAGLINNTDWANSLKEAFEKLISLFSQNTNDSNNNEIADIQESGEVTENQINLQPWEPTLEEEKEQEFLNKIINNLKVQLNSNFQNNSDKVDFIKTMINQLTENMKNENNSYDALDEQYLETPAFIYNKGIK